MKYAASIARSARLAFAALLGSGIGVAAAVTDGKSAGVDPARLVRAKP